jgi:hypothetical protein
LGRTVEKYPRPNTKKGTQRAAHHSIPALGNCRTVEKYFKTKHKKGITKEQHITNLYRWELGRTVEKYSKDQTQRKSQKSSTSLNPCFIGRNCRTVEKYLRPNTRKESQRAAHHSIPAS